MLSGIMQFISIIISIYMLIIFIRILLSWFQGPNLGRPMEILIRITEPYLAWFRRFSFLRTQRFDFSPIVALVTLGILQNIASTIATYGRITLGILLSLIVGALWSVIAFFMTLLIILIIIRLIGLFIGANTVSPFWMTLDSLLQPILLKIISVFKFKRPLNYQAGLAVSLAVILVIRILGGILFNRLGVLLIKMPF